MRQAISQTNQLRSSACKLESIWSSWQKRKRVQTRLVSRCRYTGDLSDSKINVRRCIVHMRTSQIIVSLSWTCKKQSAVLHSSIEVEIISSDTVLRQEDFPHRIYGTSLLLSSVPLLREIWFENENEHKMSNEIRSSFDRTVMGKTIRESSSRTQLGKLSNWAYLLVSYSLCVWTI